MNGGHGAAFAFLSAHEAKSNSKLHPQNQIIRLLTPSYPFELLLEKFIWMFWVT